MPHSLQCPRCNGRVSVGDDAAGKRVKCPHCSGKFLAPGVVRSENDDDDWLPITAPDREPTGEVDPIKPARDTAPTIKLSSDGFSADDLTNESPAVGAASPPPSDDFDFGGQLPEVDDFAAGTETLPQPSAKTPPKSREFAGGPTKPGGPGKTPNPKAKRRRTKPAIPAANRVDVADEYRVTCKLCGSIVFAKAEQAGQTFKCGDCHSNVVIPPPPKVEQGPKIDLTKAETFSFAGGDVSPKEEIDPFRKSAKELLEAAENEAPEEDNFRIDDVPSVKAWLGGIFGIFRDPAVVAHWLVLSIGAWVPYAIALWSENPLFLMVMFALGVGWAAFVVCCGFAILRATANQQERVTEWPIFIDPADWLGQFSMALAAAVMTGVPVYLFCRFIGGDLLAIAATMFSIYVLFPFVLLSMLDMDSMLSPFSHEVSRSVTKCEEAWGGLYLTSGIMFFALFISFTTASAFSPQAASMIMIFCSVGATFIYFAMIGRVAYAIGQAINAPRTEKPTGSQQSGSAAGDPN